MKWFSSDLHFGHRRISELAGRPFSEVQEMNETFIAQWNELVKPDEEAFILGDIALGPIMESLENVSRLNGRLHMLEGNHDRNFAGAKRSRGLLPEEWNQVYLDAGFTSVAPSGTITIDGQKFNMSHFPYEGDSHDEDRWSEHRLKDEGVPLLHGHTHSSEKISFSSKGTLQVHVGIDANFYRPISEEEVIQLFRDN